MSYTLELTEKRDAGENLSILRFQPFVQDFQIPGQFAVLKQSDFDPGYFALASSPQDPYLEFLIKSSEGLARSVVSMQPGQTLTCESIQGKGFSLDAGPATTPIHMFAMGAGLAPFRSLIRSVIANGEHCELHLWQAAFHLPSVPLLDELLELNKQGAITLHLCLDDQKEPTDIAYFAGQVHRAIESHGDWGDSRLLWIGSSEFGKALGQSLSNAGIRPEQLLTNF
ncbi:MAG: FAD-dependent oxidoreductase [Leptospiraceae bacterium]|nr:FAD-dependent oxidoreductase [Leptospiraceae bacterium]